MGFGTPPTWTLATPIEKVILDNEEKSTTYAETGDTGLLLGKVSLPTPKNHHGILLVCFASFEGKNEVEATLGAIIARLYDGTVESDLLTYGAFTTEWLFASTGDVFGSDSPLTYSLKGVTTMEIRIYLTGGSDDPSKKTYCRNCVLTVVPLYKT
jgi:hypothetical protein